MRTLIARLPLRPHPSPPGSFRGLSLLAIGVLLGSLLPASPALAARPEDRDDDPPLVPWSESHEAPPAVWLGAPLPEDPRSAAGLAAARASERSPLSFAVGASYQTDTAGKAAYGLTFLLGLPLDRLAGERLGALPVADPPPRNPKLVPPPPRVAPAPAPPPSEASPEAGSRANVPSPLPARVTAQVARSAVKAALRRANLLDPDARIDAIASRARTSALLPELRLRAARIIVDGEALAPTLYDPNRITGVSDTRFTLEARASFRLDRLVFASDEVALERLRLERADAQLRLTQRVLDALFAWQRALARAEDPEALADTRLDATLKILEAEAELDLLTDGWFTRYRERARVGTAASGEPAAGASP